METYKHELVNKVHFSSKRLNWRTPVDFYRQLDAEFRFNHDPCPDDASFDGLSKSWGKRSFVNPPYGREIGKWLKKGYEEAQKGKTVVFLIPSRTDTRWFHDYVMKANEVRFVAGRLKFDDHTVAAPFPSMVVVFRAPRSLTELIGADRTPEFSAYKVEAHKAKKEKLPRKQKPRMGSAIDDAFKRRVHT